MITEGHIKAAITSVAKGQRRFMELKDGGVRGGGRLSLKVRPTKRDPSAEWYVSWQRDNRRRATKLGVYPTLSLAEARRRFREDFHPLILEGRDPLGPFVGRRPGAAPTLEDLFEAYCSDMENKEKPGASRYRYILLAPGGAADSIGRSRPVHTITTKDILPHLKGIYDRGRKPLARYARDALRSCFQWGLTCPNDVTSSHCGFDWGLRSNPIDAIKTIKRSPARDRSLSPTEFCDLWRWLEAKATRTRYRLCYAIQLMMATGQRASEILSLKREQYDAREGALSWTKTKNGRPHSIPLPEQAIEILNGLTPNELGFYFPRQRKEDDHCIPDYAATILGRYFAETKAKHFQLRDLRRTWKTLAGDYGIDKEACDRIQNHAFRDVGYVSYDRSQHWGRKGQAMHRWSWAIEHMLQNQGPLDGREVRQLTRHHPLLLTATGQNNGQVVA